MQTIQDLQSWGVSLIAQTGFQLDMTTAQGKLLASLMASLAEFERARIASAQVISAEEFHASLG